MIVDLDNLPEDLSDEIITLQLLVMMHNETHKIWRIDDGNYTKVFPNECTCPYPSDSKYCPVHWTGRRIAT